MIEIHLIGGPLDGTRYVGEATARQKRIDFAIERPHFPGPASTASGPAPPPPPGPMVAIYVREHGSTSLRFLHDGFA
jgi:hypothetical protein